MSDSELAVSIFLIYSLLNGEPATELQIEFLKKTESFGDSEIEVLNLLLNGVTKKWEHRLTGNHSFHTVDFPMKIMRFSDIFMGSWDFPVSFFSPKPIL